MKRVALFGAIGAMAASGLTVSVRAADIVAVPADVGDLLAPGSRRHVPGVRVGAFTLTPLAEVSVGYDDNVLATKSNRRSDVVTSLSAGASLASNWSRHALELQVGGSGLFYKDLDSENRGSANVRATGQVDIARDLYVKSYAAYAFGYEPRGSGEALNLFAEPIEMQTLTGGALVHKDFNRLWAEVSANVARTTYGDARLVSGGSASQSFRDGTITQIATRLGYEFGPRASTFLEGSWSTRTYGNDRFDTDGYGAGIGLQYEFTRLVKGEVMVGYIGYDTSGDLEAVDTWSYRAQVAWQATPLMQVALYGVRDLGTPSESTGSNRIVSDAGVRLDYAVRRDVNVHAGLAYSNVDYVDISRSDDTVKLMLGAEYEWRPSWSLYTSYSYTQLLSDAKALEYDRNMVIAGLRARY